MAQSPVDVLFVLVNYHSEAHTRRCLQSIIEQTQCSFRIVVIDNASQLDRARLRADFPNVDAFTSEKNVGFGAANNIGVARAPSTKYLFFLNNDSLLLNDAASLLAKHMDANPTIGLCGAQLFEPDGRPIVSFDYFPTLISRLLGVGFLRLCGVGRFPKKDGSLKTPTDVDLVSGACLFVEAALFRSLGGFDPRFFLYCEEEDLAMRVWSAGRRVQTFPDAKVEHAGGGSSQNLLALKKEFYISFFVFYRKHYGTAQTFVIQLFTAGQWGWRWLVLRDRAVWAMLLRWLFRGAPSSESLRFAPGNSDVREGLH